jgi:hypothetical protein
MRRRSAMASTLPSAGRAVCDEGKEAMMECCVASHRSGRQWQRSLHPAKNQGPGLSHCASLACQDALSLAPAGGNETALQSRWQVS